MYEAQAMEHHPSQSAANGLRQALPIVMGYIPVGFAYGVLARKTGISEIHTILMSLLVFAGSAQFIAVSLISAAAAPLSIIATTFIVNLRHLLMSAALAPYLRNWSKGKQALFCFQLTDETFALHSTRFAEGRTTQPETFSLNMTAQCSWVLGTMIGVYGSSLIGDVKPLGLDYALTAMFIALLVGQARTNMHVLVAVISGGLSVLFMLAGAGQWNVILATLAGATIGTALDYTLRNGSNASSRTSKSSSPAGEQNNANAGLDDSILDSAPVDGSHADDSPLNGSPAENSNAAKTSPTVSVDSMKG